MSYKEALIIDKECLIYTLDGTQVVFDKIKGVGERLEIEVKSNLPIPEVEKHIKQLVKKIGLSDAELLEKSLTYLAMKETKF